MQSKVSGKIKLGGSVTEMSEPPLLFVSHMLDLRAFKLQLVWEGSSTVTFCGTHAVAWFLGTDFVCYFFTEVRPHSAGCRRSPGTSVDPHDTPAAYVPPFLEL